MQKEIVSTKLPIIPHFPPCDTKMRPCHRHCRKRNEENIPDDATRGSDTENAPASSLRNRYPDSIAAAVQIQTVRRPEDRYGGASAPPYLFQISARSPGIR
ncbi:unknown [Alistipes sp. CAG:157]|nr:unknown [Alistipes sp. CAG:157]